MGNVANPRAIGRAICCAAACSLIVAACAKESSPTNPTTAAVTSSEPCAPRLNQNPGPVSDPNGPLYHQVAMATTTDGLTLSDVHEVLASSSVPDGTLLPDGNIGIYYVNGATGVVDVARVSGGSVTPLGSISIDGIRPPLGVVDPDAQLVSAKVRLVYLQNLTPAGGQRAFCVAESSDGVNFQSVGTALSTTGTDPSVARLSDGSWLMAISLGQQSIFARSSDGVSFAATGDTMTFGGVPELTTLGDGRVRLYVCSTSNGIDAYASADAGRSWEREATVVPVGTLGHRIVCDPSMVSGTNVFLFKTGQ